jgi:hypothetical protein
MTLEKKLEGLRKHIKSEHLSMSIGELAGIYERGELDLHPKFQRFLRWGDEQKTKLVESIILRIPVPPIFVAQDDEGKWDVVDGLQRLGTLFEFMGLLKDENEKLEPPLCLLGTERLPELSGYQFSRGSKTFAVPQQLDFKRSRLDLNIVLSESDPTVKFELFERLNTGGSNASAQEVRNCILVWLNEAFYDWFHRDLVENSDFKSCVQLTERLEDQQYRSELVLRFLALSRTDDSSLSNIDDIGDFLNRQNRDMAKDQTFDTVAAARVFQRTFKIINEAVGLDGFRKFDSSKNAYQGPFLISAFEAVALGVAHNLDSWSARSHDRTKLKNKIERLWSQREFINHVGIGVPARSRIRHSIPFSRDYFQR